MLDIMLREVADEVWPHSRPNTHSQSSRMLMPDTGRTIASALRVQSPRVF